MSDFIDLTGKDIGEWHVIEYLGNGRWLCECFCGNIKDVDGHELRRGGTKSCGHDKLSNKGLEGKEFGEWQVLCKDPNKRRYWICKCSCGYIKSVQDYTLTHGISNSCGHNSGKLKDMTNKVIGEWHVDSYAGKGMWNCTCSCGNKKILHGEALRRKETKSCGCKRYEHTIRSKINIHGDFKYKNTRELWQISILNTKEELQTFITDMIEEKGRLVTNQEIANELGVTRTAVYTATKKFGIDGYKLNKYHSILMQQSEVYKFISEIYKEDIIINSRQIIPPREIDIYLPNKKLAIEYNGVYWHNAQIKGKDYHQQKTIECAKKGIRLIHIFEYEWLNTEKRNKIKNMITNILADNTKKIYARETLVSEVTYENVKQFLEDNHLQGSAHADINLVCKYKDDIVGVMTFGHPRFNQNYQYEIVRLCWKYNIHVVGGTEKLFKYFIKRYNPKNILTYVDISKFTGNIYTKLGFRPTKKDTITKPNYVWVNNEKEILSRYKTQKQKLINAGLVQGNETEDEVMTRLGYLKVYDSGNLKLEYKGDIS